jgi:DNA replication licensing factor MCM7
MGSITIGDEDLDDDYDFMDEDGQRAQMDKTAPRYKYKEQLQQLADRTLDELVVDLDDLVSVWTRSLLSTNTRE